MAERDKVFLPKLRVGQVMPGFSLPSTLEKDVALRDYKQKKNVVLFFYHGIWCERGVERLREFAENYEAFRELNAEVLAISSDEPDRLAVEPAAQGLPFPLLADTEGTTIERYTYRDEAGFPLPSVFVADRFGALYSQSIVDDERELPGQQAILETVRFIESQCPECGIGFALGIPE